MPYADKEKQKAYCRNYQKLRTALLAYPNNRVIRRCQNCQELTIQEKHEGDFLCLKCEALTE